ncbi:hypothetical protein ZOSMA_107G00610 [Zostera marina]|uniref:Uncharacterized protein n=1 Tax=Zostera marina TaxID=29655 RepID=A0A0K9Q450_ZOSMR|nr:hypothetical protein ZOSMA_107G00610 [Zostera marina]
MPSSFLSSSTPPPSPEAPTMPCDPPPSVLRWFALWLQDYDRIQNAAIFLIYVQIGCSLVGSIGAFYNGVLLVNLVFSLFALVAIESCSQTLGRTYAMLLGFSILLDIVWLILFSQTIWNISSAKYGAILAFCVKLTLWMQIISFCVRSLSSLLWIQMYRLGAAVLETTDIQETYNLNLNLKSNSMDSISSEPSGSGFCSTFNAAYNGPVDDPSQYRSLFEDAQDQRYIEKGKQRVYTDVKCASYVDEGTQSMPLLGNSSHIKISSNT